MGSIRQELTARGWTFYSRFDCRYWAKSFPEVSPSCFGNDHPGVQIGVYEFTTPLNTVYEIELRAESRDGVWMILKAYAIPDHQLLNVLDTQVGKLIRAWEAVNGDESRPKGGIAAIIGKYPGDETDEQIAQAMD